MERAGAQQVSANLTQLGKGPKNTVLIRQHRFSNAEYWKLLSLGGHAHFGRCSDTGFVFRSQIDAGALVDPDRNVKTEETAPSSQAPAARARGAGPRPRPFRLTLWSFKKAEATSGGPPALELCCLFQIEVVWAKLIKVVSASKTD
eukprot:s8327_g6.t1